MVSKNIGNKTFAATCHECNILVSKILPYDAFMKTIKPFLPFYSCFFNAVVPIPCEESGTPCFLSKTNNCIPNSPVDLP